MKEGETMDFSERLKYYREKAGYKTGKEFAKALNMSYPSYMAYENKGREPKYSVLIEISEKLNVTIDELLGATKTNLNRCILFLRKLDYFIKFVGVDSQNNEIYSISDFEEAELKYSKNYVDELDKGEQCPFLTANELINLVETILESGNARAYIGGAIYEYLTGLTNAKISSRLLQQLKDTKIISEDTFNKTSEECHDFLNENGYFSTYIMDNLISEIIKKMIKEKYELMQKDIKKKDAPPK